MTGSVSRVLALIPTTAAALAPAPSFTHLARLTDDTGLFEHARHAIARREHGYCTDDVARGLVVTCREPDPSSRVLRLAECYLTFLTHA
ncbi:glycosyltransferase, partial [Plantactinospora sp. S1510]|nr:glycosyltransferase [Plantactinospora alkalitolerans]